MECLGRWLCFEWVGCFTYVSIRIHYLHSLFIFQHYVTSVNDYIFRSLMSENRIYRHRSKIVRHICRKYNLSTDPFSGDTKWMQGIYVEHKYKLLYCKVPKVNLNYSTVMLQK